MGQRVAALVGSEFSRHAELSALVDQSHSTENLLSCDVVIDFSVPEAGVNLASKIISAQAGPALVVGSTGWKPDQRQRLEEAAKHVPVLASGNFSLGVLALLQVLKSAAPILDSLGYRPVLIETHHQHKKDAPSGTALALQRTWAEAAGKSASSMEMHSIRSGEVIGDHQISFYGPSDFIRIEHSARDRDIFARGAIEAAIWLAGRRLQDREWSGMIPVEKFFSDLNRGKASI